MKKYLYATMPAAEVIEFTKVKEEMPDGYIATDHSSVSLSGLLSKGYRWIRTDHDMAIFELQLERLPDHIAKTLHP